MNAQDVGELVALVRTLYPAQRFDERPENVLRAWAAIVGDLELDESRAALVRLARRGATWCAPGDVRREVAQHRNVLSPPVDDLLTDLRTVAHRDGEGRSLLHPVARSVYDAAGGAPAIRQMSPTQLQGLARMLREKREHHDARTLSYDPLPRAVPALAPVSERLALEGKS
jgi:hypothetical protein